MKKARAFAAVVGTAVLVLALASLCACSQSSPSNSNFAPADSSDVPALNGNAHNSGTVMTHDASDDAPGDGKAHLGELKQVPAFNEAFEGNVLWCAPMQLCWNNAIEIAGQPFSGTSPSVEALNAETVTEADMGEDHYYTWAGVVEKPDSVYTEITEALKAKFDEDSELITPEFLSEHVNETLLYAMLFREFQYEQPFDIVNDGDGFFGSVENSNTCNGVTYFGVGEDRDDDSSFYDALDKQVSVLYHDNDDDCALMLKTVEGDNVVLVKNPQGTTGQEMFENAMSRAEAYTGARSLEKGEHVCVPNVDTKVDTVYSQLSGAVAGDYVVDMARQITELKMDNEGGRVKSEAVMTMKNAAPPSDDTPKPRNFLFNDTYAMFIVDGNVHPADDYDNMVPYLALYVEDVEAVQQIGANA